MSATGLRARYAVTVSAPAVLGPVPDFASKKAHWVRADGDESKAKRFINPWPSSRDFSFTQIFTAMIRKGSSALRATWLGHACCYIEFPTGLRVLFDPVFEDKCSPVSWLGHKRFTPKPCEISEIPIVDCVIISHSHYDHLCYRTIMDIHKNNPSVQFLVPIGLKSWFLDSGISNVAEMNWWEDVDLTLSKGEPAQASASAPDSAAIENRTDAAITARISCLPCQHTSARTPLDKSSTLWASWCIRSGGKSVFFAGDTGYRTVPLVPAGEDDWSPEYDHLPVCPAFQEIGRFRGPFDLGLLPIGAYRPRYVLSSVHSNPFDAVEIFKDVRCRNGLAIHWGTWAVAEEDVMEPPWLLKRALERSGLAETGVFDVYHIGESREY